MSTLNSLSLIVNNNHKEEEVNNEPSNKNSLYILNTIVKEDLEICTPVCKNFQFLFYTYFTITVTFLPNNNQ